jgi:uncharacterized protein (DUF1501 family)
VEAGRNWRRTAILIATEFGRSIAVNDAGGTDHGLASAAFLVGGAVAGGRILGAWPGLANGHALTPSIDLRMMVTTVAGDHPGLERSPGQPVALPGLIRA